MAKRTTERKQAAQQTTGLHSASVHRKEIINPAVFCIQLILITAILPVLTTSFGLNCENQVLYLGNCMCWQTLGRSF